MGIKRNLHGIVGDFTKGLRKGFSPGRGRSRVRKKLPLKPGGGLILSRRRDFGLGPGNFRNVGY